jgi:hypothetical protein
LPFPPRDVRRTAVAGPPHLHSIAYLLRIDQQVITLPTDPEPPEPPRRTPQVDTGRLLPDVSRDETDEGWGERPDRSDDERLLDEVPPHHLG